MSASKVPHVIYQNTSFFCKELLVIIEFFEKCNKCINGRTDSNRRTVIHWCLKSSTIIISFHRNHILNFTKYEPIKSKFVLVPSRSSKYWISVIWIFIDRMGYLCRSHLCYILKKICCILINDLEWKNLLVIGSFKTL